MIGNELKPRIGIFGRRNFGKSSLINFLVGHTVAIVSDTPGATTDPVRKTMEISGIGPVILVDTAGIDDVGTLGSQRVDKTLDELRQCDLAIVLLAGNSLAQPERMLVRSCREADVPFRFLYALSDRVAPDSEFLDSVEREFDTRPFVINIFDDSLREPLLAMLRDALPESAYRHRSLLGDVVKAGDIVVLVTPIDSSAPDGRMILPQVQVLRDLLDNDASALVCKENALRHALDSLQSPPHLVVTDSQVYGLVSKIVPDDVFLTSFSVVLARAKGLFEQYIKGTPAIGSLRSGDRVLILESCTHNVTCEDIGRVKLPNLISKHTGAQLSFDIVAGQSAPPRPFSDYSIVIQCGGCVVTPRQLSARLAPAVEAGVPVSNYGLALAYLNGIFERSVRIFAQ